MHEIEPGLFVGNTQDALDITELKRRNVKLVVVAARDHPAPFRGSFEYLLCPLVDDETDDVLLHVDAAAACIRSSLERQEGVLVHCVQGVSRSVAILTGYLMKVKSMQFEEAYARVCQKYHAANTADNFRAQLIDYGLLYQWNMSLNTRSHRLYRTRNRIALNRNSDTDKAIADSRFTCRKCRRSLFLDYQCLEERSSNYKIECMEWMGAQVDASNDGPLACPGCGSKIGHFNWCGMLGDYENPAFVITGSKVDKMPVSCGYKGEAFPKTRY